LSVFEIAEKLPGGFEANQGQADPEVRFLSRNSSYSLFLTSTEAVLSLRNPVSQSQNREAAVHEPGMTGLLALPATTKRRFWKAKETARLQCCG
jgi:hypothetical protein